MGTELTAKLEELRPAIVMLSGPNGQVTAALDQCIALSQQPPVYAMSREPLAWVPEDELPASLPSEAYNALYPYSKVDFIRLFPVFAPPPQAVTVEGIMEIVKEEVFEWWNNERTCRTRLDQYLNNR